MQFRALVTILVILVIMIAISPILTGVVFGGVTIIVIITKLFMGLVLKQQMKIQAAKELMTQVSHESFQNIRTVKAFAAEETELAQYGKENKQVRTRGIVK